jgi:hypothetical protein
MASFWGLIVKAGEAQNVQLPEDHILTLTNAAFVGKASENAKLYVSVDRKYVLATLAGGKTEQVTLDLTFFPGHQLSFGADGHGEVHLVGSLQSYGSDESGSDEDSDELAHHGGPLSRAPQGAKASSFLDKEAEESEDDSVEGGSDGFGSEDDDDFDEDEDELAPPPAKPAAKPAAGAAKKDEKKPSEAAATPNQKGDKKAAAAKPAAQTPGGAGKTPAGADSAKKPAAAGAAGQGQKRAAGGDAETPLAGKKAKPETPKSTGNLQCPQCPKSLPNQQALDQHNKAKHGAK